MDILTYLSRPQGPVLVDQVQHGERHSEQAQEDVGQGKVGNEDVASGLQHLEKGKKRIIF